MHSDQKQLRKQNSRTRPPGPAAGRTSPRGTWDTTVWEGAARWLGRAPGRRLWAVQTSGPALITQGSEFVEPDS